jgi:dTDP-glucose 4,6-dehydratase
MTDRAASQTAAWRFEQDLQEVVDQVGPVWTDLRGAKLFITGGTGFIGRWLLESLCVANLQLGLGITTTILSRDPKKFTQNAPHLASQPAFRVITGDIRRFEVPQDQFTHIIHGATNASAQLNESDPLRMFDTIVEGTRRVLDFGIEKSVARLLFLSSGAVYGQQPWEMERVDEDWIGAPKCNDVRAAYAEGKRAAEMLCAIYGKQFGLEVAIARIFALLGPFISLDAHFAAGNFIRDAMQGKPVTVNSDGRAYRSYLYASDLTVWLWHLLVRALPGKPYNVGSEESVSIRELAERIARMIGQGEYRILGHVDTGWNPGRYVPDNDLVSRDLGLYRSVSLDEAIRRTALWNGWKGR